MRFPNAILPGQSLPTWKTLVAGQEKTRLECRTSAKDSSQTEATAKNTKREYATPTGWEKDTECNTSGIHFPIKHSTHKHTRHSTQKHMWSREQAKERLQLCSLSREDDGVLTIRSLTTPALFFERQRMAVCSPYDHCKRNLSSFLAAS